MNTKKIATLSAVAGLPLALSGLFLAGGCAQEEPPMPRGIYVPAPTVKTADQQQASATQQTSADAAVSTPSAPAPADAAVSTPSAPADAAVSTPSASTDEFKKQLDAKEADSQPQLEGTASAKKDADVQPVAKADKGKETVYTVQKGDSLWRISRAAGLTVSELAAYNNIDPAKPIKIGQKLKIPADSKKVKPADSAAKDAKTSQTARKKSAKKSTKKSVQKGTAAVSGTTAVADGVYVVQKGDSFSKIASKLHVKIADIEAANPGISSNRLQIGQKLNVPKAGAAVPAAKKSAAKKAEAAKGTPAAAKKTLSATEIEKELLEDIPNPDQQTAPAKQEAVPAENAEKTQPAAAAGATASGALAQDTAIPTADTTVDALAEKYGVKADDIKIMNPSLSADGKIKAGTVVRLP